LRHLGSRRSNLSRFSRWTSLAGAIDMQLVTVNSDQLTGGREFLPVVPGGNGLVYQARDGQRGKQHEEPKAIRLIRFFELERGALRLVS
jgi:hypothetical protein